MTDEGELERRMESAIRQWYAGPLPIDHAHRSTVIDAAIRGGRRSMGHRRWIAGVCAAAVLVGAVVAVRGEHGGRHRVRVTPTEVNVRFVLRGAEAERAGRVSIVGDFNGWNVAATPLDRVSSSEGVWAVDVHIRPGRYAYAFVVDGRDWIADPTAPLAPDGFGNPTSVIVVGSGAT